MLGACISVSASLPRGLAAAVCVHSDSRQAYGVVPVSRLSSACGERLRTPLWRWCTPWRPHGPLSPGPEGSDVLGPERIWEEHQAEAAWSVLALSILVLVSGGLEAEGEN